MANTTNFGWETPDDTDLVKDGALAIRTLGNAIDTSLVDLKGGTTGQILSKNSNTDLDYTWINNDQGDITGVTAGTGLTGGGTSGAVTLTNDMATTITAAGDIVVGTGSGTYDNLPIGTTGQILTADTTVSPYKVKWAAASSGALTLITRNTFTSVATVDIDSVFSGTYNSYQIYFEGITCATNGDTFQLQFRYGSTTRTATYYFGAGTTTFAGTGGNQNGNAVAQIGLGAFGTGTRARGVMWLPKIGGSSTDIQGNYMMVDKYNDLTIRGGFYQEDSQTWTGFRLKSSGGNNITGAVTVYGYAIS